MIFQFTRKKSKSKRNSSAQNLSHQKNIQNKFQEIQLIKNNQNQTKKSQKSPQKAAENSPNIHKKTSNVASLEKCADFDLKPKRRSRISFNNSGRSSRSRFRSSSRPVVRHEPESDEISDLRKFITKQNQDEVKSFIDPNTQKNLDFQEEKPVNQISQTSQISQISQVPKKSEVPAQISQNRYHLKRPRNLKRIGQIFDDYDDYDELPLRMSVQKRPNPFSHKPNPLAKWLPKNDKKNFFDVGFHATQPQKPKLASSSTLNLEIGIGLVKENNSLNQNLKENKEHKLKSLKSEELILEEKGISDFKKIEEVDKQNKNENERKVEKKNSHSYSNMIEKKITSQYTNITNNLATQGEQKSQSDKKSEKDQRHQPAVIKPAQITDFDDYTERESDIHYTANNTKTNRTETDKPSSFPTELEKIDIDSLQTKNTTHQNAINNTQKSTTNQNKDSNNQNTINKMDYLQSNNQNLNNHPRSSYRKTKSQTDSSRQTSFPSLSSKRKPKTQIDLEKQAPHLNELLIQRMTEHYSKGTIGSEFSTLRTDSDFTTILTTQNNLQSHPKNPGTSKKYFSSRNSQNTDQHFSSRNSQNSSHRISRNSNNNFLKKKPQDAKQNSGFRDRRFNTDDPLQNKNLAKKELEKIPESQDSNRLEKQLSQGSGISSIVRSLKQNGSELESITKRIQDNEVTKIAQ